jgi:glycyl-tRNA synthetase beta chain
VTDWLLEIGCEELPYKTCLSLLKQLRGSGDDVPGLVHKILERHRLMGEGVSGITPVFRDYHLRVMISPRRIAVVVRDVEDEQVAERQRFRGPRVDVAFAADGTPTKAGAGFARGKGLTPEQLGREVVDGNEFVVAEVEAERRPAAEVLPQAAREIIAGLQVPRGMRWGARPAGAPDYLRFSRPLRWLVCKLGDETLPFDFYDLEAGEHSAGHRALGDDIHIDEVAHYERHLEDQKVIVDHERRRELIDAGLDASAKALKGRWFDPAGVLDENVFLVEWPSVYAGRFDERHLRLPREVLITAMQSHQRYFPVETKAGELLPAFLYVSNGDPLAAPTVTRGNERVLEGRLDDAEFSYDRDLVEGLEHMAMRLGQVTFHEKLGSLADKAARLERLAAWLVSQAGEAGGADGDAAAAEGLPDVAVRAAGLAKADLVSLMVQEFPALQGVMGGIYGRAAGLTEAVAAAIGEHYLPLSATAPVPATTAGALVAVADKIDNIAGAWLAGEKPTGSRDPYGLRRAAMGIVRICLEHRLRMTPLALADAGMDTYAQPAQPANALASSGEVGNDRQPQIAAFMWERLQVLLLDEELPFPLVEAALGASACGADLVAVAALARTFARVESASVFNDVVVAFTRCASLAARAAGDAQRVPDPALFADDAERDLAAAVAAARGPLEAALAEGDVEAALRAAATLRAPVDRYFDDVLVMDDDARLRDNRLAQLNEITGLLGRLGDFGRLPVQQD